MLAGSWAVILVGAIAATGHAAGAQRTRAVPLAVLGDSDSHSYGGFPPDLRGGRFRSSTLQWTEILAARRGDEVDLGPWGLWGTRRRWALLRRFLGLDFRWPMKQDFRHDLALSGAGCSDLTEGLGRQLPPLLSILRADPSAWSRGAVIIRIGINSVGRPQDLDRYAVAGLDAMAREAVEACVEYIESAVHSIRDVSADVAVALVGIAEDPNGARSADRWQSPVALARIREVLDYFDTRLAALAASDVRAAFVEDRAWWVGRLGGRDATGVLVPKSVSLGGTTSVTNSVGDHPRNAITADGHAGTVVNGLWVNHLLDVMNRELGFSITPLSDAEIAALADPTGAFGIAPPR